MRKSLSSGDYPVLTKTADYALRALLVLARYGRGHCLPADTIAELTGTPPNYTSKTLYALARAGLLRSMRGPTGGFALTADPATITIAMVTDVFAEPVRARACLLGARPCDNENPCAAHQHWVALTRAAREPLRTTTLADLLVDAEPVELTPAEDRIRLRSGAA